MLSRKLARLGITHFTHFLGCSWAGRLSSLKLIKSLLSLNGTHISEETLNDRLDWRRWAVSCTETRVFTKGVLNIDLQPGLRISEPSIYLLPE